METDTSPEPNAAAQLVRRHYHPDDIIKGKPRVAKFRLRRRKPVDKTSEDDLVKAEDDGLESREEDVEYDRERPDRLKLTGDGDEGGEDKDEKKILLNMMADLQTETMVLIGDVRLNPSLEAEHMKNLKEWDDYKIKHNITHWKPRKMPKKASPKNSALKAKYATIFEKANLLSSSGKNKRGKKRKMNGGGFISRSPRKTGSTLFGV